jgi:hypothetical protein
MISHLSDIEEQMNIFNETFCILVIFLTSCFSLHSQNDPIISQITNYCDSIDKLKDFQTSVKAGAGVTLEYFMSNGKVIKIIGRPSGYKYLSAKETYYFQNDKPVYVSADLEISSEDGDKLTIELHKIHIADNRIIRHLKSEDIFDADSLYSDGSDPLITAKDIRKNASFKLQPIDQEFERTLFQAIDSYLKARSIKNGDPALNQFASPFI